jgi:orotidine-5'-phosphate decarboxylase
MVSEIVLALDVTDPDAALRLLDRLPELRWVKVGSVLMTAVGTPFVRQLTSRGLQVFLDLKWHDIPTTVAGSVISAHRLGVAMATVHTLGGARMLEAAAQAAGDSIALVGVTVLTSHDGPSYAAAVGRPGVNLEPEVERLSSAARSAGLKGVVCSPREVGAVRRVWNGSPIIVVPGIRRRSDVPGDQVRVSTAGDAARDGATHLVVGRPLLRASDPGTVFRELCEEAACAGA